MSGTSRKSLYRGWSSLPPAERALAWRLALLLPLIDLSLRLIGFQRSWGWIARFAPMAVTKAAESGDLAAAQRTASIARAVGARSPWRTSCLRQALALWLLLRRRGLDAQLKIGVIQRQAPFMAHAWVELGGVALDPVVPAGAVFPPLAPPGRWSSADGGSR